MTETTASRTKGLEFRSRVLDFFRMSGLGVWARKPDASAVLREPFPNAHSAIQGLPGGWWLATSAAPTRTLSETFDIAQRAAGKDRAQKTAVVLARAGYTADESFVVMRLDTFTRILFDEADRDNAQAV